MLTRIKGFISRIKAYQMTSTCFAVVILAILTSIAVSVYLIPFDSKSSEVSELALALATSLLASIVCISVEAFVTYRRLRGDEFIESIEQFGVSNLHFDKRDMLADWLDDCRNELWISGYRLILTHNISSHICKAVGRGAEVRILITPVWTEAYSLVYDSNEDVAHHYAAVFSTVLHAAEDISKCSVRFIRKPLFSDTYYVDGSLATGPFMHNLNENNGRITAMDFFTYELRRRSRLYDMVYDEYETLWNEADYSLDWTKFAEAESFLADCSEDDRRNILMNCAVPINETE